MTEPEVLRVRWLDATYNQSQWSRKDIKNDYSLLELVTVGHLIEDKDDCYVLASEYNIEDDMFRHIIAIPKSSIKSMERLCSIQKRR